MTDDDARPSDGPLVRALAAPLRALLGAADAVLATTLRALRSRDAAREAASPPSLRALPGGASVRQRRRGDVARADAPPIEDREYTGEPALDEREIAIDDLDDDRDLLLALPRDPRTVFVAWRLSATSSAARLARHDATAHDVRDALSIEADDGGPNVAAGGASMRWIALLEPFATSTYVDLQRARSTVRITLGTSDPEAGFVALLPPVAVRLPDDGAKPSADPRWRVLRGGDAIRPSPPASPSLATQDLLYRRATTRGIEGGPDRPAPDDASPGANPDRS